MNHIFGPVNSRRLGRSLGVDLFQEKICNLNCIYCEVGVTTRLTCERAEYVPTAEIIADIDSYCLHPQRVRELDFVTVTASGEPTLHSGLGEILTHLKKTVAKPFAVLTNGTTLSDTGVCEELASADVVIPSLDSALPASFRKLDRPANCLNLQKIIEGMVSFSHQYQGKLWLEILFARGINDSNEDVDALRRVAGRMRIDRIQLNTVARPPLESFARPLDQKNMLAIAEQFRLADPSRPVDLLAQGAVQEDDHGRQKNFDLESDADRQTLLGEIVEMLKRRPCTAADINRTFHLGGPDKVEQLLDPLVHAGTLHKRLHGDRLYYQ
jgi:wyosine [tRNA(Phe)-imidazoG37] synthetase (radical SAM superfamily)